MAFDDPSDEQAEEEIDLRKYLSLFWNWAWLILLAALIAGVAAYFISSRMTPVYEASTTVLVNEAPANKTTDYNSVLMSQKLTNTYSELMTTDNVLSIVSNQLGLSYPLEDLKDMITVTTVQDTQLMTVTVETESPPLSANIANAVATVFAGYIQDIQTQRFAQSKNTLEKQMAESEAQIESFQAQADNATTLADKNSYEEKVTQYREIYMGAQQSYEQIRLSEAQSVSSIVQVEPATIDPKPVKPKVFRNSMIAAVIGFLLAAGVIFIREALDDTIKSPEDITNKFKLPVLGVINHFKSDEETLITVTEPRSPTAEAYRTLRTNVSYSSVDKPLHRIMVTSTEPQEGKTTTICNLGVVLAQNGQRVILTDCDLRRPSVHTFWGLTNHQGLTTLFSQPGDILKDMLQPTNIDNLKVLTTGLLPPNPSELIGSQKMQQILGAMSEIADIVLVDTPPTLAVTDAAVLAPTLDGVLLVVRPGKTRTSGLRQTIMQFQQVNAHILGVVLNNVDLQGKPYAYRYHYYSNYSAYQSYYGKKEKVKGK